MAKGIAMRSISILFLVLGLVPPTRGVAQDSLPAPLREARALIVAGKIDDAIHAAERYTRGHPRDATGLSRPRRRMDEADAGRSLSRGTGIRGRPSGSRPRIPSRRTGTRRWDCGSAETTASGWSPVAWSEY